MEATNNTSPRWQWQKAGGTRLFGADGTEYLLVDPLERIEVERLLMMHELDVVLIECGVGVERWVGPGEARGVRLQVEPNLDDVEGWRPPLGYPGALPYRAELWRSAEGRLALEISTSAVCRSVLTSPGPGRHPSVGGVDTTLAGAQAERVRAD